MRASLGAGAGRGKPRAASLPLRYPRCMPYKPSPAPGRCFHCFTPTPQGCTQCAHPVCEACEERHDAEFPHKFYEA